MLIIFIIFFLNIYYLIEKHIFNPKTIVDEIKIVININQTRNNYDFSDLKIVDKIHLNCIFILFILTCNVVLFYTFVYKKNLNM